VFSNSHVSKARYVTESIRRKFKVLAGPCDSRSSTYLIPEPTERCKELERARFCAHTPAQYRGKNSIKSLNSDEVVNPKVFHDLKVQWSAQAKKQPGRILGAEKVGENSL
jgi:hypothetical protein